jgi:hypothetical protein
LTLAQVRCQQRPQQPTGAGICQVRPLVYRTQEYPDGIEFVLSDAIGDAGYRFFLARALASAFEPTGFCGAYRPPMPAFGARTYRGTVHTFFPPP